MGVLQSFLKHIRDMLRGEGTIVDDTFGLEAMEGVGDVCGGTDAGEYLVEDTARLDIVLLAGGLLVVSLDKGLAAVALPEADLVGEGADGDG